MMRSKRHYRKPDSLLLLAAAVVLGVVMTSAVQAEDRLEYLPADPGTRLMSLFMQDGYVHDPENTASRLHVSFTPPAAVGGNNSGSVKPDYIQLSWRLLW